LQERLSPGTIAGEGSAFFTLSTAPTPGSYAQVAALHMLYKPGPEKLRASLEQFLQQQSLAPHQLDLVLTGRNGDSNYEYYYQHLDASLGSTCQLPFKHLCGEYDTAAAFGVWLG